MSGPRSTAAWQRARHAVIQTETTCWICGGHQFVDQPRHPNSRSVDHINRLADGGNLLDRHNLRLAHYGCNSWRNNHHGQRPTNPRSETF